MTKRLFLTGISGCGKSTAIAAAMGGQMALAGGFLTVRRRDDTGRAVAYLLQRPDGRDGKVFLDYSGIPARMDLEVFADLGVRLLEEAKNYPFIVCSFSHKTDGDILNVVLGKEPGYVGMLGGKPKIRALFTKLKENGYSEETLKQVHAPIGLDIGGEKPAEIAVSVMAEILASRCGGSCRPMRDNLRDQIFPL